MIACRLFPMIGSNGKRAEGDAERRRASSLNDAPLSTGGSTLDGVEASARSAVSAALARHHAHAVYRHGVDIADGLFERIRSRLIAIRNEKVGDAERRRQRPVLPASDDGVASAPRLCCANCATDAAGLDADGDGTYETRSARC